MSTSRAAISFGGAIALTLGLAGHTYAGPAFTVDPSVFGSSKSTFQSDSITTESSTLLSVDDPSEDRVTGEGWIKFDSFQGVDAFDSELNFAYQIWGEFNYTATLTSGTIGVGDHTFSVDSLSFTLWGAEGAGSTSGATFTQATASGEAATVTPGSNTPTQIGAGLLVNVPGLNNVIDVNTGGGAAVNATIGYENTIFGNTFFTAPSPFYDLAFASITNDAQGYEPNLAEDYIAIQGGGTISFAEVPVPTPASIALFGIGLLVLGFKIRSRGSLSS